MKNAAKQRLAENGKRTGRTGKTASNSFPCSGRTGRKSPGGTPPGCLAGGHLLTLPEIPEDLKEAGKTDVNYEKILLYNLFEFPPETWQWGIRENLQKYVDDKFSLSGIDPVNYELYICDVKGIQDLCYEFDEREYAVKNNYLCLSFTSGRQFYDVGLQLENMEKTHPGWGKYILNLIETGVIDILTPSRCWEEAERYFGWIGEEDKSWVSEFGDEELTPAKYKEYYPGWIFEKAPEKCPEDLAEVPEISAYITAVEQFRNVPDYNIAWGRCEFMELPGSYAASGGIAWTKDRNELERDPVVMASDEEWRSYNESEGCNPGTVQFEFLLKKEHHDRNKWLKQRFDSFLACLQTFDNMMRFIENWRGK